MNVYPFQFAVLRYIHDPMTQEFINVGVVIYSREARYLRAQINNRYIRLSRTFLAVNGDFYRRIAEHIERRLDRMHEQFQQMELFGDLPLQIETVLQQVLPVDDSSLTFEGYGAGLSTDLDEELTKLYDRMVERYIEKEDLPSRSDDDIWQVYREHLDRVQVTPSLASNVSIGVPNYDFVFHRAWKNERWHPIQPVSLDLMQSRTILEKANTWIGRATMLAESDEIGTLYLLVGGPRQEELQPAYYKALRNMQDKMRLTHEIVQEDEAAAFSEKLAQMMEGH